MSYKKILPVILTYIIFCNIDVKAQDIHYSQFYHAPLSVSPSLTGIFNGDQRYSISVKDQWRAVPVPWFTTTVGYDRKFYPKKSNKYFIGGGVHINYDRQGDSNLNLTNVNLSASYNYIVNKHHIVTIAGLVGYASRGFDETNLTWDRQWDGKGFNEGAASGENFDYLRYNFFENALGLNYRWQKSSRTNFDLGAGGHHLVQPKSKFNNTIDQKLPVRISLYGKGSIKLAKALDINVNALHQIQTVYRETLFSGYLNLYVNQKRGQQTNLHLGAGYRTSGSVYPKLALKFNNVFVAASYDIDISEFSEHTNGRGGPELHFQYLITAVKPQSKFKNCPIF